MEPFVDLSTDAERVRQLRRRLDSLRIRDSAAKSMTSEQAQDVSDVLLHLESLLLKYQGRRDLLRLLEGLGDLMRQVADGIAAADSEIADIKVDSEIHYKRIMDARLAMGGEAGPSHAQLIKKILAETGLENFTKTGKKSDVVKYQ